MTKLTDKAAAKTADAAKRAYKRVETKVLVAEGRKSVKGKVRTVAKVTRKAIRAGAIAGAMAAAMVVVREIKKRRALS
jgi:ribosomal protein S20